MCPSLHFGLLKRSLPTITGRLKMGLALALIIVWTSSLKALSYYDDTHYTLNYAIGRMLGYTPEQCHRLASACYSIDYSNYTEPEQRSNLLRGLDVRTPRLAYHAFMDDEKYKDCLWNESEANKADVDIGNQSLKLFHDGKKSLNPGIFLHFYQDTFAHHGYAASWGHWFSPSAPVKPNHPLGPYCDWLSSFQPARHLPMVNGTVEHLRRFMEECCPEQSKYAKTLDRSRDATIIFNQLREANPRAANWSRLGDFVPNPAYGKEPDYEKANKVVANYTKRDFTPFQPIPRKFQFQRDGSLYTDQERDTYVLWGELRLTFTNAPRLKPSTAKVEIVLKPTRPTEKPYTLYQKDLASFAEEVSIKPIPVGDIEVNVTGDTIEPLNTSVLIDKQVVSKDIRLVGSPSVRASASVDPSRPFVKDSCKITAEAFVDGLSPTQMANIKQKVFLSGPGFKNLALANNANLAVSFENNGYRNQWTYIPARAGHFDLIYEYKLENGRSSTGRFGFEVAPPEPLSIQGSAAVTPLSVELNKGSVQLNVDYAVRNLRPSQTAKVTEKIWISYPQGGKAGQVLSNGVAEVSGSSPSRTGRWTWSPHTTGRFVLNFQVLEDGVLRASGNCPFVVTASRSAPPAVPQSNGYWEYNTAYRLTFDAKTNQFRSIAGKGPTIIGSVSGDTVTLTVDSRPQFNIVEKCILKRVSSREYRGKAETIWRNGRKPEYPYKIDCWIIYYDR